MSAAAPIVLGDPVPWFRARTMTGGSIDLHVEAGHWVVLAFVGSLAPPRAQGELANIIRLSAALEQRRLVTYAVLTEPPPGGLALDGTQGIDFIADYDGALSEAFDAIGAPRTIVLDPLLRVIANIAWSDRHGHSARLSAFLEALPEVEQSAGVPVTAPILIVPRILEFGLCDFLVELFQSTGGQESGFLLDRDGRTATVVDHRLKRRKDLRLGDAQLLDMLRDRAVRRLLPPVQRFFQFEATRMDRYMVCCYDSATGGYFSRHRDNINAGAEHRRFAVSLNLSNDYDGCDLTFPEFGNRTYRAPVGGAIVFSCGMLHEVTPITRGRRYAFLPFLYGEADAALRLANNARLAKGEAPYVGDRDRLFPPA